MPLTKALKGLLFCCLLLFSSCKMQYLRGYYSKEEFVQAVKWKKPIAENYEPKPPYLDSLKTIKKEFDALIFLGTWCSDSKKWVPRFFKLSPNLPIAELKIIAVDTSKKDSLKYFEKYNLAAVPTFLFIRDGKEIGRIVEKPKRTRLEQAIYKIIK